MSKGSGVESPAASRSATATTATETRLQFLKHVSLFEDVKTNEEAIAGLAAIMIERSYPPDTAIISEGESGSEMYFLMEGDASVYKSTIEGDHYKVALVHSKHYAFFGEGGLLDSEARSATIKSDSGCRCLVLNRTAFAEYGRLHPQWAWPILMRIARAVMVRLRKTNNDLLLLYNALVSEIRGH